MGRNVAAGMTGGLAYIFDEDDTFIPKVCVDAYPIQPFFSVSCLVLLSCLLHKISVIVSSFYRKSRIYIS